MRSFVGALVVLGLVGCGGSTTPADVGTAQDTGSSVAQDAGGTHPGQAPAMMACASCHGADLSGGQPIGGCTPSNLRALAGAGWTSGAIVAAVRTGADMGGGSLCPSMPRFTTAQLPTDTLNNIADYLLTLTPNR